MVKPTDEDARRELERAREARHETRVSFDGGGTDAGVKPRIHQNLSILKLMFLARDFAVSKAMGTAPLLDRRRIAVVAMIVVLVIGVTGGIVNAAETKDVDLTQDELVVESGDTVVIEDRDVTTPTDFIIKEGGQLIIEDSTLRMSAKDHWDNYFEVFGEVRIINSTVFGAEEGQKPEFYARSPQSQVIVRDSNLQGPVEHAHSNLISQGWGGNIEASNSDVGGIGITAMKQRDSVKQLSFQNTTVENIGIHFRGFSSVDLEGISQKRSNFDIETATFDLNVADSAFQHISVISEGRSPAAGLQNMTVKNSSVGVVVNPGTDLWVQDSTIGKLKLKHLSRWAESSYNYTGLHPGDDISGTVVDQPRMNVVSENSSIEKFAIATQGVGSPVENHVIRNSTLVTAKLGVDAVIDNSRIYILQLYKSDNTVEFDRSIIDSLQFVISVETTIKGNVSIRTPPEEIFTWGGLQDVSIDRAYPIVIRSASSKQPANVSITNNRGKVIWKTQVSEATTTLKPTLHFGKANYTQEFQLTIQQGKTTVTRPINLTSDTPIRISLVNQESDGDTEASTTSPPDSTATSTSQRSAPTSTPSDTARTLSATPPSTPAPTMATTTSKGSQGLGFGIAAGVTALLIALVAIRRQNTK